MFVCKHVHLHRTADYQGLQWYGLSIHSFYINIRIISATSNRINDISTYT